MDNMALLELEIEAGVGTVEIKFQFKDESWNTSSHYAIKDDEYRNNLVYIHESCGGR